MSLLVSIYPRHDIVSKSIDCQGEFFSIAKPVEAPFTPTALPKISDSSKMLYVWLTEYIADTAGFVYQQAGILDYNVTADMVSESNG